MAQVEYSLAAEAIANLARSVQAACGLASPAVHTLAATLHASLPWSSPADHAGLPPPPPLCTPAVILAARAFLLFLAHACAGKARGTYSRATGAIVCADHGTSAELRAQAAALRQCAEQPPFRGREFEAFFGFIERFSSEGSDGSSGAPSAPPVSLAEFKAAVVRTLLPGAPFLEGI